MLPLVMGLVGNNCGRRCVGVTQEVGSVTDRRRPHIHHAGSHRVNDILLLLRSPRLKVSLFTVLIHRVSSSPAEPKIKMILHLSLNWGLNDRELLVQVTI